MSTAFADLLQPVDPDALKSLLAVTFAVAHMLTNEKSLQLRGKAKMSDFFWLAPTSRVPAYTFFYKVGNKWCGIRL